MKNLYRIIVVFFFFLLISCHSEKIDWPETTQTSKPWTRWWWMENAVDKENLSRELNEMATAGIGGVEITPIYGVKGEEERFIEYLSEDFTRVLNYTINEANRLEMGVDLPPGSGWRCGGPFVPREKGLWNLRVQKMPLKKGENWKLPEKTDNAASVLFVGESGEKKLLDATAVNKLTENGTVYIALRIKSNNDVKRPAKGGEGWAIDTFNEEITNWYLDEFWERLGIDEGKLRCFFHDSFEYTGDFTTHFLEEFKDRRGYDISEYLDVLAGDCENQEIIARVKSDYRETLSDLVLESFIQPMTVWANNHKSLNRNQAHGSPGNILDLYAACDIPETEIFRYVEPGTVDVFVNKFASSAAHVTGQKLVSSESFTWLDEHWMVSTSDWVRATNRFFLAGINHMFFHGTCYSPADAEWPGWLFYASSQINNRNPLWRELPALFKYIERTQSVLQSTTPENDLLIYWPYSDVAASEGRIFNHLGVNKDAGWFKSHPISNLSEKLSAAGYTFDYISDKQLKNCALVNGEIITSGNSVYKTIVLPKTAFIPLETMQKLSDFIQAGGKVIFDETLPESVPGMFDLEKRIQVLEEIKKCIPENNVGDAVQKLTEFKLFGEADLAQNGFHYIKMKMNNENVYLVFNTSLDRKDAWVNLNTKAHNFIFMNPMNGEIKRAATKNEKVRIQLNSEEIVFVKCMYEPVKAANQKYLEKNAGKKVMDGRWKVEFVEGGPVFPGNFDMDEMKSWTKGGDLETERFAGTAKYTLDLNWDGEESGWLDLGDVRDCAHVYVNEKDYGTLLGPAFSVYIENLKKGANKIELEVTNVAANRIRDLDKRGVVWRKFYDINLVNIEYQPFDASNWEIKEAGLLGPVTFYSN